MDLVDQEKYEIDLISHYLPAPLSEAEIIQLVEQTMKELNANSMSDMGKIMGQLKPILQGRADMAKVSAMIKAKLSE